MIGTGHFVMWSIILVGLFNSIMFPSILTLGVAELGLYILFFAVSGSKSNSERRAQM
jgi:fucose permease